MNSKFLFGEILSIRSILNIFYIVLEKLNMRLITAKSQIDLE
jgi:hypothetical protein